MDVAQAALRREALSTAGKAALQPAASRPSGRVRPKAQSAVATAPASVAEAPAQGCGCGCNGAKGGCGDKSAPANVMPAAAVNPATNVPKKSSEPTGRALARARRAAWSQDGKAGLKRVAQATKIATVMPQQDWQAAIAKGATGRQLAMQRRKVQSLTGRDAASSSHSPRPAGRQRARMVVPAPTKVEQGHTLSGGAVTGTMVERSKKVTGNEPGSCRPITGTEYIGAEQYQKLCNTAVEPMPAKVGVSSTLREHKVTGTEVGRSQRVTGDEVGACRGITGTEYLAAERFDEMCSSRPCAAPCQGGRVGYVQGQAVITGTSVTTARKRLRAATNPVRSSYHGDRICGSDQGATAPQKVAVTHTSHGKQRDGYGGRPYVEAYR
jgi:hypothetical protein